MTDLRPVLLSLAILGTGSPALAQDAVAGAALFSDFCAVCHGVDAQGEGPMAEALTVQPPDLTQLGTDQDFPLLRVIRQIDGRAGILAHGGDMPLFGRGFEGQGADVAMPGPGGQPVLMSAPIADLVAFLLEKQS